jgi:hypothetical protein
MNELTNERTNEFYTCVFPNLTISDVAISDVGSTHKRVQHGVSIGVVRLLQTARPAGQPPLKQMFQGWLCIEWSGMTGPSKIFRESMEMRLWKCVY